MISKSQVTHFCLPMFLLFLTADAVAYAGPSIIGLVKGSTNASIGEAALLPDTALFSGDSLDVGDGLALVALGSTSRMLLYHQTRASFLRDSDSVTVLLGQGAVSLFHAQNALPVRMKVGDLFVAPVSGLETLGDVAAGSGVVKVTARSGRLRVEGNGQAIIVAKGQTLTLDLRAASPQSATEASAAELPLPSLGAAPKPSVVSRPGASPAGVSSSASGGEPSPGAAAKAGASEAPPGAPLTATAPADTIERALKPLPDRKHPPSPHKPHH